MEAERLLFQQREAIYIFFGSLCIIIILTYIFLYTTVNTTEEKKVSTEIKEVIWNNPSFREDD
jgi:hypothetical protein